MRSCKGTIIRIGTWMKHLAHEERKRAVFVQPGEKTQRRDLIAIYNYIVGECRGDAAGCLLERHADMIRGNKNMLECEKFH